ncbi:hypothetical protein A0256_09970 [Mucilaginibacter sp. PAMC 26640]|nr:hypothetical protein A0256_09970 [Mucilaginibacter sp. PAMC 26640]
MNTSSLPGPTLRMPLELELARARERGPITARQRKQLQRIEAQQLKDLRDLEASQVTGDEAFIIKKADDWLTLPDGEEMGDMLFGDLWFKNELCILFADTNAGKSILAVQIGDAIARGAAIGDLSVQRQPEPVLYFDFELSAAQFAKRYSSKNGGAHRFPPNFYRVVINPNASREGKFATYHDYLINSLENIIITTGSRTIILDNITCLRSGTENAAAAIKLMRSLQNIKNLYLASLLVLAHTPKRNPARPITRNDLQGSKMLMNFADSAFAIGESQTSNGLRYLKQIKQRSSGPMYGANNVKFCRLVQQNSFLMFRLEGHGSEGPHLLAYTGQVRRALEAEIMRLHGQGQSLRQIAKTTSTSFSFVYRLTKRDDDNDGVSK